MALHNLSIKLSKELLTGFHGKEILKKQIQSTESEIRESLRFVELQSQDLDNTLQNMLQYPAASVEDLRIQLNQVRFSEKQSSIDRLRQYAEEKQEFVTQFQEQLQVLESVPKSLLNQSDVSTCWLEHDYQIFAEYRLNILDLETSLVDFFAVSKNRKVAFLILLELNRNAPESNVLKLYYYLKNSQSFWEFEDIVILQVFSPKYIVEKKGKSLSLAREMSAFLGNELFTGVHSFGEQKVRISYSSYIFGEPHYEIFSVFWKLMADEADEEERFNLMCKNLPTNKNFLALCKKYMERERARRATVPACFESLVAEKGSPDDIAMIFKSWCTEILQFVEHSFHRYHNFNRTRKR